MSGGDPVCSRCKSNSSLMWQRDSEGAVVCLECHTAEKEAKTLPLRMGNSPSQLLQRASVLSRASPGPCRSQYRVESLQGEPQGPTREQRQSSSSNNNNSSPHPRPLCLKTQTLLESPHQFLFLLCNPLQRTLTPPLPPPALLLWHPTNNQTSLTRPPLLLPLQRETPVFPLQRGVGGVCGKAHQCVQQKTSHMF